MKAFTTFKNVYLYTNIHFYIPLFSSYLQMARSSVCWSTLRRKLSVMSVPVCQTIKFYWSFGIRIIFQFIGELINFYSTINIYNSILFYVVFLNHIRICWQSGEIVVDNFNALSIKVFN